MHSTSDFKKGLKLLIDDDPYVIVDFQHVKPGKGNQFTRTKLRNLVSGSNLERTFKSGEKFGVPNVETKAVNFLYQDDNGYHFMDPSNFEQYQVAGDDVGEARLYLTENLEVSILFFNDRAIGVDVPNAVVLTITETEPGVKGNTVTGGSKPATLETGAVVQVPLHINEGDRIKIDTRTNEYLERVNK